MNRTQQFAAPVAALLVVALLQACGGGSGNPNAGAPVTVPTAPTPPVLAPGAPVSVGDVAQDGLIWFNYRRSQIGIPTLTANTQVAAAAQAHSNYQNLNGAITHTETNGNPGFTGVSLANRLTAAGYAFGNNGYAYGEVISATSSTSGSYMADELITAIYHRFVIFEPKFKEIGTGAASTSAGYTYFTADFTANGYGPGIARSTVVGWPFDGQTGVPTDFFSDYESPDPVAGVNEVGYPVSVHADIDVAVTVQSFTIHVHGSTSNLAVKLLSHAVDAETPPSAAAIVPLAVLLPATVYDVSFVGTADGSAVSKSWSFTTH